MAKGNLQDRLERLGELAHRPVNDEAIQTLRKALTDRTGLVVAQAAKVIGEIPIHTLIPDLVQAFHRMWEKGTAADPKCWGKRAIVDALKKIDYSDSEVFLKGLTHIQMEPVWGGQEDSAISLRGSCALALLQSGDLTRRDKFRHLVDALADPAEPVRGDVVRAIGQMEGDEASLLLRLKARLGDERTGVTGQTFEALLAVEGEHGVPFVSGFLESAGEELCEEAALALATSKLPGSLAMLKAGWAREHERPRGDVFLRAMSVSGLPEAIDFLVDLIRKGSAREMRSAIKALELHAQSKEIQQRVEQARNNRDPGLSDRGQPDLI